MKLATLDRCPGTLAFGYSTYSPKCLRSLFQGKKVSHILPFDPPDQDETTAEKFIENRKRISISGVQEKLSFILDQKELRLTQEGEQGTYILKPIPRDLKQVDQLPANEHLTMQIAQQVYGIHTAANALIFFNDGTPAYVTKRFDIRPDMNKWGKEDFATLAGKTTENAGTDFKYQESYEAMGHLIKSYVAAAPIEMEKFFRLVLFNYAFSNGDAHLKNFSLLETLSGDYLLSPAYNLVNTKIHIDDNAMALDDGLFSNDYETDSFKHNGFYAYDDFFEFGQKLGISERRVHIIIKPFIQENEQVIALIQQSFLNAACQTLYLDCYQDRLLKLAYSFSSR